MHEKEKGLPVSINTWSVPGDFDLCDNETETSKQILLLICQQYLDRQAFFHIDCY